MGDGQFPERPYRPEWRPYPNWRVNPASPREPRNAPALPHAPCRKQKWQINRGLSAGIGVFALARKGALIGFERSMIVAQSNVRRRLIQVRLGVIEVLPESEVLR